MTTVESSQASLYLNAMAVICAAGHDAASLCYAFSAPQTSCVTSKATSVAAPRSRLGQPLRDALSNSFAFGGSNASLLFGAG